MVMESISVLMDGELGALEAQREIARIKEDRERRECWESFHLVGDALRGEKWRAPGLSEAFAARLAAEPTVLAPQRKFGLSGKPRRFTTYALSAAASLSAVALVAWVAISPNTPVGIQADATRSGVAQDLAASALKPVTLPPANVASDGRMNEYLLAHQGFSPSTALQGLAPYIRSVSATRPAEQGR
jgi:sigma-E factor negative regulatory protein RseA